ncbi:unnamed protein product [Acanthoscelides obtectus]|uniref:Uncharacterized protein n=1 Tax=Acanthoscelides obtectus TaxID=200917 RepID=A0A9P0PDD0_ACAOB|nr:unnamed protein product [Acanthoscelides obtectus]CAK1635574.1 Major royal jelly protein 3 [Acanthoscelides obtectus]
MISHFLFSGNKFLCLVLGLCAYFPSSQTKSNMKVIYKWSYLEYEYNTETERRAAIDSEEFIPGKGTPIDVNVFYGHHPSEKKMFVTIPRFQKGVPFSVGTVTNRTRNGNPIIAPFPSWDWYRNVEACGPRRIVSVYRIAIDRCGRLWVLDNGVVLDKKVCQPQILAFDIRTGRLAYRHELSKDITTDVTLMVTIMADVRDSCDDVFIYSADCQGNTIYVTDVNNDVSWAAKDKTMYPWPPYGTYNILGTTFDIMDGVLGMALDPYQPGTDRKLYYHAMSSPTENWVYTSHLRNRTMFQGGELSTPEIFHTFEGKRSTQSAAEVIDSKGTMYFGLNGKQELACYDTKSENYGARSSMRIIEHNDETLQFISGVKVVKNSKGIEELWAVTTPFQKVYTDTVDTKEINFRILGAKIDDLAYGTGCRHGSSPLPHHQMRPYGHGY